MSAADGGFALRRKDLSSLSFLLSLVEWDDDFDDDDDDDDDDVDEDDDDEDDDVSSPPSGFHVDGEAFTIVGLGANGVSISVVGLVIVNSVVDSDMLGLIIGLDVVGLIVGFGVGLGVGFDDVVPESISRPVI